MRTAFTRKQPGLTAACAFVLGVLLGMLVAVGYADRIGTDASNQTLSRERVDVVRTYLVSKANIEVSGTRRVQP